MSDKKFGTELRRLRREADLTLADLADELNVTVVYLSAVERGERNPPPPDSIKKLLDRIGKPDRLFDMLVLAAKARKTVEIPIGDKADDVADMLVALARSCNEGKLSDEAIQQIQVILKSSEKKR